MPIFENMVTVGMTSRLQSSSDYLNLASSVTIFYDYFTKCHQVNINFNSEQSIEEETLY